MPGFCHNLSQKVYNVQRHTKKGRRPLYDKDEQMTLMTDLSAGPAGRNYADPYSADRGERPTALCATVATLIVLIVGLLVLLVALKPLVALVMVSPAVVLMGRCALRRVRKARAG